MATTPNYGWVTPAPTDFVTDLPADFEVFADAVDADLAGLLGGTTGQLLTKDSNADHDFSWTTVTSGGMTQIATQDMAGISTVTFSAIPQTYKYLVITGDDLENATNQDISVRWNGITATVYQHTRMFTSTTSVLNTTGNSSAEIGYSGSSSANVGGFFATFPNYKVTNQLKHYHSWAGNPPSNNMTYLIGSGNAATAIRDAITSITVFSSANFVDGDITLWGVN